MLNESGDFDFQFDGSECGTKHTGNAKKPVDFFYLMFKPVWWRILVEQLRCWIRNPGVLHSKLLGGSKVGSAFHPSFGQ